MPKDATVAKADDGGNVPKAVFLKYVREATATQREIDRAGSAHRNLMKRAKSDGVDPADIKQTMQDLAKDPTELRKAFARRLRNAGWAGIQIGTQGEMFADDGKPAQTATPTEEELVHLRWEAGERGYAWGFGGGNGDVDTNPFPPGDEFHPLWYDGWVRGQAALVTKMGPGVKKASDRKDKEPGKRGRPKKEKPGALKADTAEDVADAVAEDDKHLVKGEGLDEWDAAAPATTH